MKITITNSAAKRIITLIAKSQKPVKALRISIDGGGCSGFMYNYLLVESTNDNDDFIQEHLGAQVAIDSLSQEFLDGCIVDFVEQLGSSYFHIKNPKATANCGCGNSFAV
ncbi:MAG: HesB/IscA family protein [Rickettsiaceae bacterium]